MKSVKDIWQNNQTVNQLVTGCQSISHTSNKPPVTTSIDRKVRVQSSFTKISHLLKFIQYLFSFQSKCSEICRSLKMLIISWGAYTGTRIHHRNHCHTSSGIAASGEALRLLSWSGALEWEQSFPNLYEIPYLRQLAQAYCCLSPNYSKVHQHQQH